MLSESEFNALAQRGYNRIPLMREVLADCDTPVGAYRKLAARPYSYLLESVQGGEKWGRYSTIGLPCRLRLEVRGARVRIIARDGEVLRDEQCANPLDEIRNFQQQHRAPEMPGIPRFCGGLVGFFGYGTVRCIEPRIKAKDAPDAVDAPDIVLLVSDEVVVFDNLAGRLYVILHADPTQPNAWAAGKQRIDALLDELAQVAPDNARAPAASTSAESSTSLDEDARALKIESNFPRERFEAAVEQCRRYIKAGDVFQVALSQRMSVDYFGSPLDLYRALRTLNPSPYMYYLDLGDFHIAGASPEILVRLEDGEITVRPIAGTRKRGEDAEQDAALAKELLADPKERAEHVMLIDLGRNDVGRVAQIGTVKVTEKMMIEKYSHVMHIVSNVCGQLDADLDAIDLLKATFPAGTLSGAPKVRALEIIEELEPDNRGVYSGAIGYLGWNGNLDTAIAIRTALIKDRRVHIQVGAGIVADSIPSNEWEETMNKGRAVLNAVALAERQLRLDATDTRGR